MIGETRLPWLEYSKKEDPRKRVTIELPAPPAQDQLWKLYIWGAGDFGANLRGIPAQVRLP